MPLVRIICCGEEHDRPREHWNKVHQKTTKVYFPEWDPKDRQLVPRDPDTQRFHCPGCGETFELASALCSHTQRKCHANPPPPPCTKLPLPLSLRHATPPKTRPSRTVTKHRLAYPSQKSSNAAIPSRTKPQEKVSQQRPSPIKSFLSDLRLPCTHLLKVFEQFGVTSMEHLDALCMESGEWDGFKAYLLGNGAKQIEWLMIKAGLQRKKNSLLSEGAVA